MSTPFSVYSGQIRDLRTFDGPIDQHEGPFCGAARHRLYLELIDRGLMTEYGQVIWCRRSKQDAKQDDEHRLLHTLKITSENIAVVLKRMTWAD